MEGSPHEADGDCCLLSFGLDEMANRIPGGITPRGDRV